MSPLTREINRVLDRIQELQTSRETQTKDYGSHLRKIERELRDLSAFVRGRPEPSTHRDRRDVASGKTPSASVSGSPPRSQRLGYLSPPPLRPDSPASFITSVSFLSSHYSDDMMSEPPSPSRSSSRSGTITVASSPPSAPSSGPSRPPSRAESSSDTTATARPRPDLSALRDMLTALQQQHARMMQDQKDTRDLVQQLVDEPRGPPPPPAPAPVPGPSTSQERDGARRGVENLLGRILNALGLPAEPAPPSREPSPPSEGSSDEGIRDDILREKLRKLNPSSPILEPTPLHPSSELNLEDWESYLDSEEQGGPPPTLIDLPPPITYVSVPTGTGPRPRSVSPESTLDDAFDAPRRRRRSSAEREEQEWEEGTSSSGPPRPPTRGQRPGDTDPGLDFLNLVKDHRRARRGGDGTFIPGDQPVVSTYPLFLSIQSTLLVLIVFSN